MPERAPRTLPARGRAREPARVPARSATAWPAAAGNRAVARLAAGAGILRGGAVHPAVVEAIAARAGRGNRLDTAMARWSQSELGHSAPHHIRVHHDAAAAGLAAAVSARAFTVRNDVFFGAGEYRPQTSDGRQLIAHELTHTAQQQGSVAGGPLRVTEPGDAHERHADAVAGTLP